MLAISNLCTVPQSPSISRPFCIPKIPRFQLLYSLMASSSKIVVEYAKSNRSSCKKCAETIAKSGMRLGLVSRDSRGFDMTKWHHVDCLPFDSNSISTAVAIGGFSELKSSDQEILKKLVDGGDQSQEKVQETDEDLENKLEKRDSKKTKVQETDEGLENDLEERDSKKTKVGSFTFVVEYAKSNRSSCKKCAETIAKSAMRLGLVSRDSRGFDMTKWHHVNCLSFDSNSISTAEAIGGFSELKSSDQEILKKLVDGGDQFQEKVQETGEDLENELEERCSAQVQETGEDLENELEERDSKKTKLSAPNEGAGLELNFSISDIKNEYKDAKLLPKWKAFQTIIFLERDDGLNDSSKVAAFDFDGCLAKTSVKRVGPDAWSLMYPSIPEKLQSLYNDGYKLVIFTNESNIERWKNKRQVAVDSKIGRLNNFIKKVKVPIQVFIACGFGKSDGQAEDPFRKPKPGMWHFMEQHLNSGIAIDMNQSFYVGDAAGRDHDHSDADIKFAQAIGLKFYLPEEYFGPDH